MDGEYFHEYNASCRAGRRRNLSLVARIMRLPSAPLSVQHLSLSFSLWSIIDRRVYAAAAAGAAAAAVAAKAAL